MSANVAMKANKNTTNVVSSKIIVFDAGPIITLAINSLLWSLKSLKEKYGGRFLIPTSVKREIIDKPLSSRKYKLEAFQIAQLIDEGVLEIYENDHQAETEEFLSLCNSLYSAKGKPLNLVQYGEAEAVVIAQKLKADAFVVDEKTTRLILENPEVLKQILERKLRQDIKINKTQLNKIRSKFGVRRIIRSLELITVGFELGLYDKFISKSNIITNPRRQLIDALLWGARLNGCSTTTREIEKIVKFENSSRSSRGKKRKGL